MVPKQGTVVFDWDNTLKLYDKKSRQLKSRVSKPCLQRWKQEKCCDFFIISAIYPSRLNLETLLLEVAKLDLQEIFTDGNDVIDVKPGQYAKKGNIVICGYDKAETFVRLKGLDSAQNVEMIENKSRDPFIVFFDDEEVNVRNFSAILGNKVVCYLVV